MNKELESIFGETQKIEETNYEIVKTYVDYEENIYKVYLRNYITGQIMIPQVSGIVYEPHTQVFKIHDEIEINKYLTINVYFYYTWSGKVLGCVYNDYCDAWYGLNTNECTLVEAYSKYKEDIKEYISEVISHRMEKHEENASKFLHLVKRDDKSESKI